MCINCITKNSNENNIHLKSNSLPSRNSVADGSKSNTSRVHPASLVMLINALTISVVVSFIVDNCCDFLVSRNNNFPLCVSLFFEHCWLIPVSGNLSWKQMYYLSRWPLCLHEKRNFSKWSNLFQYRIKYAWYNFSDDSKVAVDDHARGCGVAACQVTAREWAGIPRAQHAPSSFRGVQLETDASSWVAEERQCDLRVPSVTAVKLTLYTVKIIKRLYTTHFVWYVATWFTSKYTFILPRSF